MASLNGETIVLTTAPLPTSDRSVALLLQPDVTKREEEEEEEMLENLKKELKEKQREAYMVQRGMRVKMLEWHKIHFRRAMEKALLTNSIIKERSLLTRHTTPDYTGSYLLRKAHDFNKKIRRAIFVGLDGILFGPPSDKEEEASDKEEEEEDEEFEEELEDLTKRIEAILLQIVPEVEKEVVKYCKNTYRRARPFAKLESREEHLTSIVKSLLEREAREIVFQPTENELLGYMLLKEIASSTLQYPHILFHPNTSLELPDYTTLPSSPGDENERRDENIVVGLAISLFTGRGVNCDEFTLEALVASNYDSVLREAKSAANKSDQIKLIKEFISMVEVVIEEDTSGRIETRTSQLVAERCFEEKLVDHYEKLSDMRLARCLNQISQIERNRLEQIVSLAGKAIGKYAVIKGLPDITRPVLPSYPHQQDVTKKEGDEDEVKVLQNVTKEEEDKDELKVLENLKKELKAKHTEAYVVRRELRLSMLEWHKITFIRTMEKAWFTNSIIKERCLLDQSAVNLMHKALDFNEKIKCAISQGLYDFLFAPSNKRKRTSSDDEGSDMVKSRGDNLASIVISLLERETQSERETTQNEILGYMLLQEIANSTLRFPPSTSMQLPTLASSVGSAIGSEGRDEKILVGVKMRVLLLNLFTERANDELNETSWACMYDNLLIEAKLASNNSISEEMERIKLMISQAEGLIEAAKKGLLSEPSRMSKLAAERPFEAKLVVHCQDLSHLRLDTCCAKSLSETEVNRLMEISCLATKAIDKYREAKGTDSLPQITEPVLPSYRPY